MLCALAAKLFFGMLPPCFLAVAFWIRITLSFVKGFDLAKDNPPN
jgi:hypothetical protein